MSDSTERAVANGFGRLALHTWTVDTTPLPEALAAARDGGFDAVELRWTDFKRRAEAGLSNEQTLDEVRAAGIPVAVLGVEYGWFFARAEESRRLFDVFALSARNAVALGCPMLMSAPGPLVGTLPEAADNLRRAADLAGEHGLRLAIEFNSQHPVINRMEVVQDLLEAAGRTNAGLLLDAYHLHRSGRPGRGFAAVAGEAILAFQYSDVPPLPVVGVPRPTDRLPPGQGVVEWGDVLGLLREKGFAGHLSYEAPNPALWARSALDVAREGVEATRRLFAASRKTAA